MNGPNRSAPGDERGHAAQAPAQPEEHFKLAFDNSAIGMCLVSPEGRFLTVNPALCAMLGRDADALLATTWRELTHPDDLIADGTLVEGIRQGRLASYRLRKRYLMPDGASVWGDVSVSCTRNEDGTVRAFIAQIVDASAQVAAEEALRASQEHYQLLAENSADVILKSDRTGTIDWASPSLTTATGWLPAQLVGHRAVEFLHPDDVASVLAAQPELLAGEVRTLEARLRQADGTYRWFSSAIRPILDKAGAVVGRIGGWRDIQREVEARERLRESEERYRLLAENASAAIFRASVDGVYTWMSASVTALLGWSPEELVGTSYLELTHPADVPRAQAALASLLQGTSISVEVRLRSRFGAYQWTSVWGRPLLDEKGAVFAIAGSWRTIQAEVEARTALESSQAQLRTVLDSLLDPHVVMQPVHGAQGAVVDFIYADANRAACAYMRMEREQLVGARLLDLLPGQAGSGMLALYADALASGKPLVLNDYAYAHEILASERRYDIRGVQVGENLSFTWRDVTERYEAIQAVRRRVAELAALQQLSEMLVQRVDLAGAVREVGALLKTVFAAKYVRIEPEEATELAKRRMALNGDDAAHLVLAPLVSHGEAYGTIAITRDAAVEPFNGEERALAATIADFLAAVIRGERLHELETEQAAEEERRRIARDLHDAVTQSIYSANLIAESLPAVFAVAPEKVLEDLLVIRRLIRGAFAELRILLFELRPETLAIVPLATLLQRLGDALAGHSDIAVALCVDEDLTIPSDVRTVFYRVAQEALNNVGKYAGARHVDISLAGEGATLRLTVRDDGRGFDPAAAPEGMGTSIMRERAESIGAEVSVESAPGSGTAVTLVWRPRQAEAARTERRPT